MHRSSGCSPVRVLGLSLLLSTLATSQVARADQARDFMIDIQPDGPLLMVDALFPGIQGVH